jgi:hypothetical protein
VNVVRPKFTSERLKQRRPVEPKKWSHQQDLNNLMGKKITITFAGAIGANDFAVGVLTGADQFTIQLLQDKSVVTYFKHDMRSFEASAV